MPRIVPGIDNETLVQLKNACAKLVEHATQAAAIPPVINPTFNHNDDKKLSAYEFHSNRQAFFTPITSISSRANSNPNSLLMTPSNSPVKKIHANVEPLSVSTQTNQNSRR